MQALPTGHFTPRAITHKALHPLAATFLASPFFSPSPSSLSRPNHIQSSSFVTSATSKHLIFVLAVGFLASMAFLKP